MTTTFTVTTPPVYHNSIIVTEDNIEECKQFIKGTHNENWVIIPDNLYNVLIKIDNMIRSYSQKEFFTLYLRSE